LTYLKYGFILKMEREENEKRFQGIGYNKSKKGGKPDVVIQTYLSSRT